MFLPCPNLVHFCLFCPKCPKTSVIYSILIVQKKEVHVRISSPPFLWPCYFGTDVPAREQLIAYNRTTEQIREVIGADSLGYLRLERLSEIVNGKEICRGCFTGQYPMEPPVTDIRGEFEE